ncbi:MAG: 4Fe-4S cluster-binding domain-containing protein, partial [bacterium]|nr:4Fe-4S cluster-binding domain-containing protein [bacterium]
MGIKYLEKTSLIDFPGIISSIIFFGGCNFKCSYCYNKPLVIKPELIPDITEEEIAGVLNERKNFIEGVVFTGGEPSIYPGLLDFIKKI